MTTRSYGQDNPSRNPASALASARICKQMFARLSLSLIILICLPLLLIPMRQAQAQTVPLIVINEIIKDPDFAVDTAGEWIELYNAGSEPFDLDGCTLQDDGGDSHLIANGGPLVINPGQYLVLGRNGDSTVNGGVAVDYVYDNFALANADDEVVLVCGGREIDRVNYDDGLTFPDPIGASLQLSDFNLDNHIGANWCQAAEPWPGSAGDRGTPGGPTVCATFTGTVVINEIMADPTAVSDANGEWLELYNPGSTSVDLNGCRLKGNTVADNHPINNGGPLLINPGQYLVLGRNGDPATNGGVIVDYTYTIYSLNNTNDIVMLECAGIEVDQVNYDPTFPGPTAGASLQLSVPSLDNNDGDNWCGATTLWSGSAGDRGTPGSANNCPADLALTKTVSLDKAVAGQALSYTLVYVNNGPSPASGVVITDIVPSALTNLNYTSSGAALSPIGGSTYAWSVADLLPGAGGIITITGIINPDFPPASFLTNTASLTSTALDSNTINNRASVTTVVTTEADLSISKSDSSDPVTGGESLIYTLHVSNAGPSTATAVTVTDMLPDEVTFVSASGTGWSCSQAGGVVTCTRPGLDVGSAPNILIRVTAPNIAGVITNTATVTSSVTDPTLPNTAIATTTVVVIAAADLSIIKSDTPDPVTVNGRLTYTLNVSNAGPNIATAITVTDTLPAGVSFISASGAGWICGQAGVVVTCTRPILGVGSAPNILIRVIAPGVAGVITNTTTVTSSVADPTLPNTAVATTTITALATADLSISKSDSPDPALVGEALTYTLNVNNAGPSTATAITVTDTLPAGVTFVGAAGLGWSCTQAGGVVTCTRPSLGVGSAPDIIITVTAPSVAGIITNTVSVTSGVADPTTPNTAIATTTVTAVASADLTISKNDTADPVTVGGLLTYSLNVNNAGPSVATAIIVTDTLPNGVDFVGASGTGWSCGQAGGLVTCTRPGLGIGSAPSVIISVTAPNIAGVITNTATVTSGVADPTRPNTAIVTTTVEAWPTVQFDREVYPVHENEGRAIVTATLSAVSAQTVSVNYASTEGTALAGSDYQTATGILTFAPGTVVQTFTMAITDDGASEGIETLTLTLSNSTNATLGIPNPATLTIVDQVEPIPESGMIYLPLIMNDFALAPDLVVHNLIAGNNAVTVTIKNIGNTPVSDAFWVDVYLNPTPTPTGVNQEWWELAGEGLVWGVTQTIPAGGELALTIGDVYYSTLYSGFSGTIPPGTPVWAQVDSVNLNTTYGGVLEGNEHNNISGPVPAAATTANVVAPLNHSNTKFTVNSSLPSR